MSKFVLKTTTDGIRHLYLDDPDKDGFVKLASKDNAQLFKFGTCALLYNNKEFTKQLFGIINNKVFHVEIPFSSTVEFHNSTYIFEKNGEWNTVKLVADKWCNKWCEQPLGHKEYMFMSAEYVIKHSYSLWVYFLRECGSGVVLSHIVDGKPFILGMYCCVKQDEDRLIAKRNDECYDVFEPNSEAPIKGSKNEFFDTRDGLFIWNSLKDAWILYAGFISIGKNAAYRPSVWTSWDGKRGDKIELYRICDGELCLELDAGKWSKSFKPLSLHINDKIYIVDNQTERIDFENPKLTFWGKFKKIFKIK